MKYCIYFYIILFFFACKKQPKKVASPDLLFEVLDSEATGIHHYFGKMPHAGLEGGGVGIGDFDGDGLQDVFLVGDSLHGLYKNIGDMQFENRFTESGIRPYRGGTSVAVYDINKDGLDDLILGRRLISNNPLYSILNYGNSDLEDTGTNLMIYLNKGNFQFETDTVFFIDHFDPVSGIALADFNRNGYLEIAVSSWYVDFTRDNNALFTFDLSYNNPKETHVQIYSYNYELNRYTNTSSLWDLGYGSDVKTSFSLQASDLDRDGWIDLYVTNDFDLPDKMFFNVRGEYFKKKSQKNTIPFFSMGIDIADINNDLSNDIFITDMRPYLYKRDRIMKYEKLFDWNYNLSSEVSNQAVKNHALINVSPKLYAQTSEMFDMDATEWSWSVLCADFNNNQHKDIFIANGYFYQYFLEHDSPLLMDSIMNNHGFKGLVNLLQSDTFTAPYFKNFFFRNNGELNFTNVSDNWQSDFAYNTRGAAYADLDNDGDLDLVLNNAKQASVILKNKSDEKTNSNFLRIKVSSSEFPVLHTQALVYADNEQQFLELNPCRGFYSSSESILHFGLATNSKVDSLIITWPNGRQTLLKGVEANQLLTIEYNEEDTREKQSELKVKPIFQKENIEGLGYLHQENDYNDFQQDMLLPQMYSRFGPYSASGDLTGNGLDDLIIGGTKGFPTSIFYQVVPDKFKKEIISLHNHHEDACIAIFDLNQDGLNDIIIASGGNELPEGDDFYQHRYYINKGNGQFEANYIRNIKSSASVVKPIKIEDKVFLFIGGRITAQKYPLTPQSYLLEYTSDGFKNITSAKLPDLQTIGMVTDAIWTDYNGDGDTDLIIVGEYMTPQFFKNIESKWINDTKNIFGQTDTLSGFWNCIVSGDFNSDGKPDYVIGNLGLNTRYKASADYPLEIYANDFDDNGSLDVITCFYEDGNLYPVKHLNTFKQRINGFSKQYYRHSLFASHTIFDMFDNKLLNEGFHAVAHTTASILLLSNGKGGFTKAKLPFWAQVSPIMTMLVNDFDEDGFEDVLIAGNYHSVEVERGKYTAQKGLLLKGDGIGGFEQILPESSGFLVDGECRNLQLIDDKDGNYAVVAAFNSDSLKVFQKNTKP